MDDGPRNVAGIGRGRPSDGGGAVCVGGPEGWERDGDWCSCPAEGGYSLVALCHSADLSDCPDQPVIVHLTACSAHRASVRAWLRERADGGEVQAYRTDELLRRWSVVEAAGVPIWGTARAG